VAQTLVQNYKLSVVDAKSVTVNGLPAYAMVADQVPDAQQQQQQQTAPVRVLIYLIQYGGNIYNLMGVTTTANFNNYAPTFSATMQNFRQLTDTEKLRRQADHIRIKTVPTTGTLAQALRSYKMPDKRLEEISILNGMALTDQVTKGSLIKIVQK